VRRKIGSKIWILKSPAYRQGGAVAILLAVASRFEPAYIQKIFNIERTGISV
jgi:hypothetical protein